MKITAYKAKDGTIYETESEQKRHDKRVANASKIEALAESIWGHVEHQDDRGNDVFFSPSELARALARVFEHKRLRKIMRELCDE